MVSGVCECSSPLVHEVCSKRLVLAAVSKLSKPLLHKLCCRSLVCGCAKASVHKGCSEASFPKAWVYSKGSKG